MVLPGPSKEGENFNPLPVLALLLASLAKEGEKYDRLPHPGVKLGFERLALPGTSSVTLGGTGLLIAGVFPPLRSPGPGWVGTPGMTGTGFLAAVPEAHWWAWAGSLGMTLGW